MQDHNGLLKETFGENMHGTWWALCNLAGPATNSIPLPVGLLQPDSNHLIPIQKVCKEIPLINAGSRYGMFALAVLYETIADPNGRRNKIRAAKFLEAAQAIRLQITTEKQALLLAARTQWDTYSLLITHTLGENAGGPFDPTLIRSLIQEHGVEINAYHMLEIQLFHLAMFTDNSIESSPEELQKKEDKKGKAKGAGKKGEGKGTKKGKSKDVNDGIVRSENIASENRKLLNSNKAVDSFAARVVDTRKTIGKWKATVIIFLQIEQQPDTDEQEGIGYWVEPVQHGWRPNSDERKTGMQKGAYVQLGVQRPVQGAVTTVVEGLVLDYVSAARGKDTLPGMKRRRSNKSPSRTTGTRGTMESSTS